MQIEIKRLWAENKDLKKNLGSKEIAIKDLSKEKASLEKLIEQIKLQRTSSTTFQNSLLKTEQTPEFRGPRGLWNQDSDADSIKQELASLTSQLQVAEKCIDLTSKLSSLLVQIHPSKFKDQPRPKDIWRWVRSLCSQYMELKQTVQFNRTDKVRAKSWQKRVL